MNKTITIYELLGLVKDGKAPNKIKFCDEIFTFNNDKCNFLYKYQIGKCQLFGCCKLNDTVEIIEDNDKLENNNGNQNEYRNAGKFIGQMYKELVEGFIEGWNSIEERLDER